VIPRWIDWCAQNKFLIFTGTLFLVLAGAWTLRRVPLDALPDISDVQVVIHTAWNGEPPNLIEDQVTYPIVTTLLAAPSVVKPTKMLANLANRQKVSDEFITSSSSQTILSSPCSRGTRSFAIAK